MQSAQCKVQNPGALLIACNERSRIVHYALCTMHSTLSIQHSAFSISPPGRARGRGLGWGRDRKGDGSALPPSARHARLPRSICVERGGKGASLAIENGRQRNRPNDSPLGRVRAVAAATDGKASTPPGALEDAADGSFIDSKLGCDARDAPSELVPHVPNLALPRAQIS